MTPTFLQSVLLFRSVTFKIKGTPRADTHFHTADGLVLELLPTGGVVISEKVKAGEKEGVGAELYRAAPANVAGYALLPAAEPAAQVGKGK